MQTVPSNFEPAPDWGRIEDIQRRVVHVGRSVIYQWINDGLIESVAVRKRSAKTGCRLRSDRKSSCLGEKRAQSGSKSRGGAFGARCGSERLRFQFRRAESEYHCALELAPQNPLLVNNLAGGMGRLGRLDEAVAGSGYQTQSGR